ncbi:MAG TPA: error-prone DNA polymerase [Acidimicrobiales bacterium]|jgi:error-prone DNA polymerase|nr:error-prone DNA polymerase [Acidimicrobiales bacterium]
MGFNNPKMPWRELEKVLSGRTTNVPVGANGGDSPAWSRKRQPYEPEGVVRRAGCGGVPYAELHCHSNFSFLDGASHPEELVEEAARLGLEALALTDHNGMYGVVRFAEAASAIGMPTVFGAELSLGLTKPQNGVPDPEGTHLLVLARNPTGYARLCAAITKGHLEGREKGKPVFRLPELAEAAAGQWVVLTGCRKGPVPSALVNDGPAAAARRLADLVVAFGRDNVVVELWDHGDPLDSARNDALAEMAVRQSLEVIATNNVHYATPSRRSLATALAAVRARRSLDEIDGWLPPAATAHLRSGDEQARRFARYPGVVERAAALARECAFDLRLVAPNLPDYPVPDGHTEMSWLRELTWKGALERYGPRSSCRVPGAYEQIEHELDVIEQLGFPGYFLIVYDIVQFCRRNDILCQGRGSAANSAACYALGITAADAVKLGLLFERFLSPERDGPPDIDIDIESDRREEVIQYVYERYGRQNAAQVANVITYRAKSSIRDMAKALGFAVGQQDAWSKQADPWGPLSATAAQPDHDIPAHVLELAGQVQNFPRHLGIHSGGMVICDRPVSEVVPVEWGRLELPGGRGPARTVLQWDKDDCAAVGLVKFDLLGLGMLSALHYAVDLIRDAYGVEVDLATIPQEDEVYDMLCRADSVGVFQVESRAQMATLPRLKPRTFYDLVVEVALIRPGPIQGGSVHPYIRRRNGKEPVTYLHPLLEPALKKTLGVPLFQEQLMQMAIDVAGFTPGEADQLRQAMGSKRSRERMERLRARLYEGMAERGITGEVADQIYDKLAAFANFGFPESHSVSFAYLVYSSSWIKLHYPDAFCAALLNAQPMGFYSPQSLVADARRHDVVVLEPDVNESDWRATVPSQGTVRLGIKEVRHIGEGLAKRIAAGRPYESMEDVVRRNGLTEPQVESLATAGAFACFGLDRRRALWAAGAVTQSRPDRLPGVVIGSAAPALPGMNEVEHAAFDLWSTGISPRSYPTQYIRDRLDAEGIRSAAALADPALESGSRVRVAGIVTHRQRPATAQGTTFVNLEDETGLVNVVCSKGLWARYRRVARTAPALLIRGRVEKSEGVINVIADKIDPLSLSVTGPQSRDFR